MGERTLGSLSILPRTITISSKNLKQIWVEESEEGEEAARRIKSMLVEIPYTRGTLLQLILSNDFIVITLYFRETWRNTNARSADNLVSESTASDINQDLPSNQVQLDEHGQVIYSKGTYFPGKEGKLTRSKKTGPTLEEQREVLPTVI
jgi:hypothetical protein